MALLAQDLEELPDWNCCGATMYMSVKETVALALSARNLGLAERRRRDPPRPLQCLLHDAAQDAALPQGAARMREQVEAALAEAGLSCGLSVQVRHPLDVIVNDVGVGAVARLATRRLDGLKVAPYYGCQIVRPGPAFDDPDWPTSMDDLFTALGAECVYFPDRVRCCGGMLDTTAPALGEELTRTCWTARPQRGRRGPHHVPALPDEPGGPRSARRRPRPDPRLLLHTGPGNRPRSERHRDGSASQPGPARRPPAGHAGSGLT